MFRWFETRIEAFPDEPPARPPETLLAFYVYFIKPVWPAFAVLLVAGFLGSLIEVSLLAFVGSLVDMMKAAETPADLPGRPLARILLWMAFVALVARPLVSTAHDLIKNQIIAGPVTNRVRWLTHRYVLRQSLGFFQNDFAGRVANKVMQAAPALREFGRAGDRRHLVRGRAVGRRGRDLRRRRLAPAAAAAGLARRLHRRALSTSCRASRSARRRRPRRARCWSGRIVDSYTNILTVKLFAHADREDGYARAALRGADGQVAGLAAHPDVAWSSCSTRSTAS